MRGDDPGQGVGINLLRHAADTAARECMLPVAFHRPASEPQANQSAPGGVRLAPPRRLDLLDDEYRFTRHPCAPARSTSPTADALLPRRAPATLPYVWRRSTSLTPAAGGARRHQGP